MGSSEHQYASPMKVSHDGPSPLRIGRKLMARTRRATSLLMLTPKALLICCAIRGHPNYGLRCFIATMAGSVHAIVPWDQVSLWGRWNKAIDIFAA
jgi:hypothetical protein